MSSGSGIGVSRGIVDVDAHIVSIDNYNGLA